MKKIFILILTLSVAFSFAQENNNKVKYEKQGDLTKAVYYHDNGEVAQTGTFNSEGKLHGTWISFNEEGEKVTEAKYENGKKEGKWFFWSENTIKEVQYENNIVASVNTVALQ